MKNLLYIIFSILIIGFLACKKNNYKEGNLTSYWGIKLGKEFPKSFYLHGDSLIFIDNYPELNYIQLDNNLSDIYELELYISNHFGYFPIIIHNYDSLIKADFSELADNTDGEMYIVHEPISMPDTIIKILNHKILENSNILLLIDKSGSMGDDISYLRESIDNIIENVPANSNLAAAAYNDNVYHLDWYTSMTDFTNNYSLVKTFINELPIGGGGGNPGESVYDAIYESLLGFEWSSKANKSIIIIGDEPPLKGEESNHTFEEVILLSKDKGEVNLYPILIR